MSQNNNEALKVLKTMFSFSGGARDKIIWAVLGPVAICAVLMTREFESAVQRQKKFHERTIEILHESEDRQRLRALALSNAPRE